MEPTKCRTHNSFPSISRDEKEWTVCCTTGLCLMNGNISHSTSFDEAIRKWNKRQSKKEKKP